jgi:hypothetical protein
MTNEIWLLLNLIVLACNIGVLALAVKFYTEYFKERVKGPR